MIKIKELIDIPSLNYHVEHGLTLHENVYRYSSDKFIQLFAEAREALRDGKIQLNEEDLDLLESIDIGEYGEYEGKKVPLDLPMVEENYEYKGRKYSHEDLARLDLIAFDKFGRDEEGNFLQPLTLRKNFKQLPDDQKDQVLKLRHKVGVREAEYRGKDVPLNKPKRGGPKKFVVYTKNDKGNVVKVNFGGTTGLNVKIDEPGARASFAARHKCAQKKDKTKPGYWACNIGRYWKSLGGKRNFSGYW